MSARETIARVIAAEDALDAVLALDEDKLTEAQFRALEEAERILHHLRQLALR